jgi:orotate phosphoribosyltransferase
MAARDELRGKALKDLQTYGVLMLDGHFDYGNGFHGAAYLNAHQLFWRPSTIWRFAQDLIDVTPAELLESAQVVAGPVTGGALLAHTIAGLLDARRPLARPPYGFAPFNADAAGRLTLRPFYARLLAGARVLLADDVRNTGQTLARCAALVEAAGGRTVGTMQICDRMESTVDLGVPNVALAEIRTPANFPAPACPLCGDGRPITRF